MENKRTLIIVILALLLVSPVDVLSGMQIDDIFYLIALVSELRKMIREKNERQMYIDQ